jgi:hypothetical protein
LIERGSNIFSGPYLGQLPPLPVVQLFHEASVACFPVSGWPEASQENAKCFHSAFGKHSAVLFKQLLKRFQSLIGNSRVVFGEELQKSTV